ncbi:ABC transporter permease [Dactylosporangium sp. AC04546]|uniref:ABC transporter permease n=1 Tax=Dactylosporangium sp. AC04546 TaxID=2862460 RepID=UPI001EE0F118|nr:ABC transporter permease [Dactylosporangium sp. AC04546]WVK79455.1 ABC transporter permease [Dactylosporangium sp. AC04546]
MTTLTGTGALVRLILRRDRVLMPIWMLFMALLPLSLASGTASLYKTDAERQGYIDDLGSSPMLLLFYGTKPATASLGALVFWRSATGIVIMALIGLLFVIRHTRVEEEAGRRELLGATVVGRHAGLAAAIAAMSGASLVVGVLVALGMMSQQTPAAGAFAMGLAWAFAGILFAAIGAVTAQLSEGAGAARGIGIALLGASFAVRGVADVAGGGLAWLSWVSPLGWVYQIHAYTDNRWWILALAVAATLGLAWLAVRLSARRDLGAGLLPPRLGPAVAAPTLAGPLALAWRLHRGTLYGWLVGLGVVGGLLFGGVAQTAGELLDDNEQLAQILQRIGGTSGAADIFIAGTMGLGAIAVAAYGISAALRMRTEEAALRTEPLLATGVSRLGWAASHLVFAFLGPTVVMAVTGLTAGLLYGASTGDVGREVPRVLAGALVQLPAIWVLAGLAVASTGLLPRRASAIGWAALSLCVVLGQIGAALQLSQAVLDISPFTHIPRVPGGSVTVAPLLILTATAAALVAAGLAGLRRRDIPVT